MGFFSEYLLKNNDFFEGNKEFITLLLNDFNIIDSQTSKKIYFETQGNIDDTIDKFFIKKIIFYKKNTSYYKINYDISYPTQILFDNMFEDNLIENKENYTTSEKYFNSFISNLSDIFKKINFKLNYRSISQNDKLYLKDFLLTYAKDLKLIKENINGLKLLILLKILLADFVTSTYDNDKRIEIGNFVGKTLMKNIERYNCFYNNLKIDKVFNKELKEEDKEYISDIISLMRSINLNTHKTSFFGVEFNLDKPNVRIGLHNTECVSTIVYNNIFDFGAKILIEYIDFFDLRNKILSNLTKVFLKREV